VVDVQFVLLVDEVLEEWMIRLWEEVVRIEEEEEEEEEVKLREAGKIVEEVLDPLIEQTLW